jgi:glycosyltransferase involved in cell wall biosynthesis
MKSLLLINYEYPPIGAGAANATFHIAKSLAAQVAVTVLTARYGNLTGTSVEGPLSVVRCPALRRRADRSGMVEKISFITGSLLALPALVKANKFDGCIAFFSIPCGPVALVAKAFYGIPYVISLRGGDVPGADKSLSLVHFLLTPLRRAVLARARAVVANSEGLQRVAESADPFPVRVIPNGVDTRVFTPRGEGDKNDNCFRVLYVGRLQEQKNVMLLLEQFATVCASHRESPVELHIVGDGPERTAVRRAARALNIMEKITWHGWLDRDALLEAYRRCDCFVNPSLSEGSPNTVLEAMACGLPVIASDILGNNELVADGETGFLFDLKNPSGLAEKLELLVHDQAMNLTMGKKARQKIEAHYSWEKAAAAYLELF